MGRVAEGRGQRTVVMTVVVVELVLIAVIMFIGWSRNELPIVARPCQGVDRSAISRYIDVIVFEPSAPTSINAVSLSSAACLQRLYQRLANEKAVTPAFGVGCTLF